jgi:glycerol dehydrogenase-like iron-containing ADH family enzyme
LLGDPVSTFEDYDSTKLADVLAVWREAERVTERAQTALGSARRAAVAAKVAADAVAELAREAELTLQAAERARNISLRAALEAGAAVEIADLEVTQVEGAVGLANGAFESARDTYLEAARQAQEREERRR